MQYHTAYSRAVSSPDSGSSSLACNSENRHLHWAYARLVAFQQTAPHQCLPSSWGKEYWPAAGETAMLPCCWCSLHQFALSVIQLATHFARSPVPCWVKDDPL